MTFKCKGHQNFEATKCLIAIQLLRKEAINIETLNLTKKYIQNEKKLRFVWFKLSVYALFDDKHNYFYINILPFLLFTVFSNKSLKTWLNDQNLLY